MEFYIKIGLSVLLSLLTYISALAQANTCATAEVLCSLNELDGFMGSMPETNVTGEFPPGGLCPGGGTNQNITWFAFIAGSASATINLITSNCMTPGGGGAALQYGIYTDCNFNDAVLCVSGAVPAGTIPITINGMIPGDDYFFFIDGDLGTYCDYEIEVLAGGNSVDLPQPTGINCISADCPISGSACLSPLTLTFEVEGINLSIDYVWTISPEPPMGNTVVGSNQNTFTFNDPGTYEICVFAENGCTDTDPVCYDLVIDPPEAGSIIASPTVLCPGVFSNAVVSGYNMDPDFSQAIIAVDPNGTVIGIASGDELDFTYIGCGIVTVYSYNFNPVDSPAPPSTGDFFSPPQCINTCCDLESIDVSFEDSEPPVFLNPPQDLDVLCEQDVPEMQDAIWNDNCAGTGTVAGVQTDNFILCQGGLITRSWMYTDDCGNPGTHIQFITISTNIDVPVANDVFVQICFSDIENDTLYLQSLNPQVNSNSIFDFNYYASLSDAQNNTNELDNEYIFSNAVTIYVTVTNECDCKAIGQININANPVPNFDIDINHVSCIDSMDGIITLSGISPIGTTFGFNDLNYTDELVYDSLSAGSFVINSLSPEGCTRSDTIIIEEGQELTYTDLSIVCNTNGTVTDSDDDFFDISFTISNSTNSINNVTVSSENEVFGNFPYGEISFTIKTGASQTITVEDEMTGCSFTFDTGELSPCSDNCMITIDSLSFECSDMGTLGLPDDDVYTMTFIIDAINSTLGMYTLYIDGLQIGTYTYEEIITYNLTADSLIHDILFVDSSDTTCFLATTSPALMPCSGQCSLETFVDDAICNNQQTTMDSLDDTFSIDVTVTITSGSGQWTVIESGEIGESGDIITLGPYLISDGNQTVTIQDINITSCTQTLLLMAPGSCSDCDGIVEAGDDWLLNCSVSNAQLSGMATPTAAGSWSGPNGFSFNGNQVVVDIPGTYYFSVNYGDDCMFIDSLIVDVSNDIPQIAGSGAQSLTCLVDSIILMGIVMGGSGNLEYRWLDVNMDLLSNSQQLTLFEAGSYFLEVYDIDSDCTSPRTEFVIIDETADLNPVINADPSFILDCLVDEITLQVIEEPNVTYQWYINNVLVSGTGTQITVTDEATIILEATHIITGCTGEALLNVEDQIGYPIVSIQPVDILNCENTSITLDGSTSQMGSTISYTWLDVDSNAIASNVTSLEVTDAGIYYLQLIDEANNCINWDTVEVISDVSIPEIQLEESATIPCDQEEINILLTVTDNTYGINWITNNGMITSETNGPDITANSAGLYIAEVTNLDNLCVALDSITIDVYDQITNFETNIFDESCEESGNGSIFITSIEGGGAPFTFEINGQSVSDEIIENLSQGTYTLLVTDSNGCSFENDVTIDLSEPMEIDLVSEITIFQNESRELNAKVNIDQSDIARVMWSPSEGISCDSCLITQVTSGNLDVVYTVGVTDIYGCYSEAMVLVKTKKLLDINAPNILNPTNEGSDNSRFTIYSNKPAIINDLAIYDRWGNVVFNVKGIPTNEPSLGWNGEFGNKTVSQGVYVFRYMLTTEEGEVIKGMGDLTVL